MNILAIIFEFMERILTFSFLYFLFKIQVTYKLLLIVCVLAIYTLLNSIEEMP